MDVDAVAREMLDVCVADGQCVRRIPADADAEALRGRLRTAAAAQDLRIRTARLDDAVVVARLDADLWHDDAATMRRKLAPSA